MDTRSFGLRNCYSIACAPSGPRQLSPLEAGRRLFGLAGSGGLDGDVLLANGGRLLLDVLSHPEYATPACGDVRDLVVHDKAGERILEGLLADAVQRLREEGIPRRYLRGLAQRHPGGGFLWRPGDVRGESGAATSVGWLRS